MHNNHKVEQIKAQGESLDEEKKKTKYILDSNKNKKKYSHNDVGTFPLLCKKIEKVDPCKLQSLI